MNWNKRKRTGLILGGIMLIGFLAFSPAQAGSQPAQAAAAQAVLNAAAVAEGGGAGAAGGGGAADAGTGITPEMIAIAESANTADAGYSIPPTYIIDYLTAEAACGYPRETGVTTNFVYAPDRVGTLVTFTDAFCVPPGCYYTMGGNYEGGGLGECVR